MTRHNCAHTGLVTPSLPQLLLTAMLHVLAMLVSSVSSTLQMIIRRPPVIGTQAMPAGLPRETSDTNQETNTAAQHRSPIALMVSSTRSVRPSNHEGVLTTLSHTHNGSVNSVHASPAQAGVQSPSDKSARSAQIPFAPSLDPGVRRGCVSKDRAT